MAAELFYVPQPVAFTTNGFPAAGAEAYFYEQGTLTPADVFTSSALTVAHPHPVEANGSGRIPTIYLDDTVNYRLIIKDRLGNTLSDEDPYIPPMMPFSITGLSFITPQQFGAIGDGVADDSAAFAAAQAYAATLARPGFGYNNGVPQIWVPFGVYNFAGNAFDITYPIHWIGEGSDISNAATVLKWNNTSSGLRVQYVDTVGDSGTQAAATHSGSGATFEGIHFEGGFDDLNEAERHAVHARAKCTFRRCNFFNWAGDGICIDANVGGGHLGNANIVKVEDCLAQNCRNGYSAAGGDSSACDFVSFDAISNRRWGALEGSFLGNKILAGHFDVNARTAWNTGAANHPCSYVHDSGNLYFVIHGQEVGAATNRPSTTTADNTWWGWWQAGGANPGQGIPTWFNGIAVRSGGAICVTGLNNASTVVAPHIEVNSISQYDQQATVIGASTAGAVAVSGGALARNQLPRLRGGSSGIICDGRITVSGPITALLGIVSAPDVNSVVQFGRFSAAFPNAYVQPDPTATALVLKSPDGNDRLAITNALLTLSNPVNTTGVYQKGGVQVVGARDTGWAADTGTAKKTATAAYVVGAPLTVGAAYVQAEVTAIITRQALVEAALRDATQEIKAMKDALIAHGLIGA